MLKTSRRAPALLIAAILAITALTPTASSATESRPLQVNRKSVLAKVRAGHRTARELRKMTKRDRARSLARCVPIAELTYCIGLGWNAEPDYAAIAAEGDQRGATGDMTGAEWVRRRMRMTDSERRAAEVAEVNDAMDGIAKVRRIEQLAADQPLSSTRSSAAQPEWNAIMQGYQTRQIRSNYCGPATLQMLDWADDGTKNDQDALASNQLDTTSSGTSIQSMVAAVNRITGWPAKAEGKYQVVSVASLSVNAFYATHKLKLGDSDPSPIIEHPKLLARYYWYINYDHSGHYQVGRGYQPSNGDYYINLFEPFNERDYRSTGANSWGPRSVRAADLLSANKANAGFQNIGF